MEPNINIVCIYVCSYDTGVMRRDNDVFNFLPVSFSSCQNTRALFETAQGQKLTSTKSEINTELIKPQKLSENPKLFKWLLKNIKE